MNSIKILNRMDTIFANYRNSITPDLHKLLIKLLDKYT